MTNEGEIECAICYGKKAFQVMMKTTNHQEKEDSATMLKVFTSFSGYDSQCLALNRLPIDYELVGWSEIDANAIKAHNALFPQWTDRNFGDISKVDWSMVPDFDLFTYSSPCQDFSAAGLQKGGDKGSGTRSSLLWECERAIEAKRPRYLLMENVAALVSAKFIKLFNQWQLTLEKLGYKNWAKVLDAQDFGVPQHRERIILVSILDEAAKFEFPKPIKLTKRIKDILEADVPERYYIKDEKLAGINIQLKQKAAIIEPQILTHTRTEYGKAIRKDYEAGRVKEQRSKMQQWQPREDGISNTITHVQKDNLLLLPDVSIEPKIVIVGNLQPENLWKGNIRTQNFILDCNGICCTINATYGKHPFKITEYQANRGGIGCAD